MDKKTSYTLKSFFLFVLIIAWAFNVSGATHSNTFNGRSSGTPVLTDSDEDANALFGYSDFTAANAFIINGITVPLLKSGWYNDKGLHGAPNWNYVCGVYAPDIYRNFFAVDLSNLSSYGITPPITSAVLHICQYTSVPATGVASFSLYNVSTNYATINQTYSPSNPTGIDIFSDLGSGSLFAKAVVDRSASESNFIDVPLNSTGITSMNSSIGSVFIVGGSVSEATVPVPYWAIALVFIAVGTVVILRFKKKQLA